MSALLAVLKIRPGEGRKSFAMFLYLFTSVSAFIVGRISRDTLFLELPNAKALLPYMYVGIAAGVSVSVYLYSRLERLSTRERVTAASLVVFAATVFGLRPFVHGQPMLIHFYYVWVDVFGTIMIIQAWGLANSTFNAREAKRLFAFIGGGGVLANVVAGVAVKAVVDHVGADNLLLVCGGAIVGALVCQQRLLSISGPAPAAAKGSTPIKLAEDTSSVLGSRHLQIIATIVTMMFFVSTVVDYQFKVAIGEALKNADARASYFGVFYSVTGVLSALIQFFLTSRLLDRFGVLVSLALLPVFMFGGAIGMLIVPGLFAASWLKGTENTLRYTVNDATMNLLYVPVPSGMRARAKSFIDGILKPVAIGVSGLFLVAFGKDFANHELSYFTAAVLLAWALLLIRLRSEYVKTLMLTLRKRRLDFADSALKITDDATINALLKTFDGSDEPQIMHALELLPSLDKKSNATTDKVLLLLPHPSIQVRLKALAYIGDYGGFDYAEKLSPYLNDPNDEVRAAAVRAFATLGRDMAVRGLEQHLKDSAPRVKAAAVAGLIQHGGLDGILRSAEVLKAMLTSPEPVQRVHAAWVLGEIRVRTFYQPVLELLQDQDARVRQAATVAAGKMQSTELVPALIYQLEDPRTAGAAAQALAQFGPELEGILAKVLANESESPAIRQQVPKVLARRGTKAALDLLMRFIDTADLAVRGQVLAAAARLHDKHGVSADAERIQHVLREELHAFYTLCLMRADMQLDAADVLMADAIAERIKRTKQRLFKLLALVYPTKTLDLVALNLFSPVAATRANAVEILDNILEGEHKRLVVPMAEERPEAERVRVATEDLDMTHKSRAQWLEQLLSGNDAWLVTCALEMIGRRKLKDQKTLVTALQTKTNKLVAETAHWAGQHL